MDIRSGDDGIHCKVCGKGQWGQNSCIWINHCNGRGNMPLPKEEAKAKVMKCKAKDAKQALPQYVFLGETRCDLCHKHPLLNGFHDSQTDDIDLCDICFERWNNMVARSCAKCGVSNGHLASFIEFVENK